MPLVDLPSSSPSPPSLCTLDSSPAPSPSLTAISSDSPPGSPFQLSHPYAASAKATRIPPQYEKRSMSPSIDFTLEPPTKRHRIDMNSSCDSFDLNNEVPSSSPCEPPCVNNRETTFWDEVIANVFDKGNGTVELTSQGFTYIPDRIKELSNFVVLPEKSERFNGALIPKPINTGGRLFTRITTAPVGNLSFTASRSAFSERTQSAADASIGLAREEIQLFLSGNQITALPSELFAVQKMTVLIMRGNQLAYLPPEIASLSNLRELNVSNNRLQYLPAEMLNMTLKQLHLHPNPFRRPPESSREKFPQMNNHRPVSLPTHPLPRVLPLVEMCFRVLLSAYHDPENASALARSGDESVLSAFYQLPLQGQNSEIPKPLLDILHTCLPGSVTLPSSYLPLPAASILKEGITGIGVCPGNHRRKSIFIRHAEERFTWEDNIAQCPVGGAVPLRWRGCNRGCLDICGNAHQVEIDGDPSLDVEMATEEDGNDSGVVQVLSFASDGFGLDDFED